MKKLTDLVGKKYAATGTFTEIKTGNILPGGQLQFCAKNARTRCSIEGILFDMNANEIFEPKYRVQIDKITDEGHTIDLVEARKLISKQIREKTGTYEFAKEGNTIKEIYSGEIKKNIPIIRDVKIQRKRDRESSLFDIKLLRYILQTGFNNIITDRHIGKVRLIGNDDCTGYNFLDNKKSIIIDVVDGEFIGQEIADHDTYDTIVFKETGSLGPQDAHIRAGQIRHYHQPDGKVKIIGIAPYTVRTSEITSEQKKRYYLGPNAEISQQTLKLTEKRGTLGDKDIDALIAQYRIPPIEELYPDE